jgi:hypothetical protein
VELRLQDNWVADSVHFSNLCRTTEATGWVRWSDNETTLCVIPMAPLTPHLTERLFRRV